MRWEYLGKNTEESGAVPGTAGDASVKLDFGLSETMLDEATRKKWPHAFGLTYSVTLSPGELQTSIEVRNTGEEAWEFKTLLHSYFGIDVRSPTPRPAQLLTPMSRTFPKPP